MSLYLLTSGDHSDGNPWDVIAIYTDRATAEADEKLYDSTNVHLEEWEAKETQGDPWKWPQGDVVEGKP